MCSSDLPSTTAAEHPVSSSSIVGQALPDPSRKFIEQAKHPTASLSDRVHNLRKLQHPLSIIPTRPVPGQNVGSHPAVEAGVRPFMGTADVAMLDWVVVNVIEVSLVVVLIANRVFPKSRLPDATSTLALPCFGNPGLSCSRCQPAFRELFLDPCPASRIVRIPRRQRPDRM